MVTTSAVCGGQAEIQTPTPSLSFGLPLNQSYQFLDIEWRPVIHHPGPPPGHRHDCEGLEDSILRFAIVYPMKGQMIGLAQDLQVS